METLIYFAFGILTAVGVFLLGYASLGVLRAKRELEGVHDCLNSIDVQLHTQHDELHRRIDMELEDIVNTIEKNDREINSQLDSRLDKLETKLKGLIPPTNDELMKRIEKIEEESYRLRMNL